MSLFEKDEPPKRPASVWIAQILMVLIAVFYVGLATAIIFKVGPSSPATAIAAIILPLILSAIAFIAFIGMLRRRPYGRWTAVGLLALAVLSGSLQIFWGSNAANGSGSFRAGYSFGQLLPAVLLGWLVFALIKSDSVSRFFTKPDSESDAPPPVEYYSDDFPRKS